MKDSGRDLSHEQEFHYLRTELLERIAHELRGPAGVTLGALDELEHALGPAGVEQNRLLFAMARRGARRVLRTAERLTRTALLESGSPHISLSLGDVRGVTEQAVQDAELVEGRSSIRVKLSLPSEPCMAKFDSAWLTVAVSELAAQAIRAARREVEVSVHENDGHAQIVLVDDRQSPSDMTSARFVTREDRRDSSLSWPLVWDVTRAHGARLTSESLKTESDGVRGFRVLIQLKMSA